MNDRKPKTATERDHLIGSVIRARRMAAGLTLRQLGDKLGVTHQQIGKYESGTSRIAFSRAVEVAEVFGCEVQDLLVMPPSGGDA